MFACDGDIKEKKLILDKCLDGNAWIVASSEGSCGCNISFKYTPGISHNFIHFIRSLLTSTNPVSSGYSIKEGFLTFDLKYESETVFRSAIDKLKSNILLVSSLMNFDTVPEAPGKGGRIDVQSLRVPGHDYL